MSDKDFNERDDFTKLFPNASLLIRLFHTLRIFKREVSSEKLKINSAQRGKCLEILKAITYSVSSEQCEIAGSIKVSKRYRLFQG